MMNNLELERLLNEKLSTDRINDYAPNGLQVEGKAEIKKIITVENKANFAYMPYEKGTLILFCHGFFSLEK